MMKRIISKLLFKLNGWKVVGPHTYPEKCMVITAPHTSNWDFLIGRCYAYIIGIVPKYLIKSELFLPVLGTLLRWNGGIPVYRIAKHNVVDQVVEMINNSTAINIGIAPEGTRTRVEKWKTGFYHIAVKAIVPILLLKMDYEKKEIGIMCYFIPCGNFEKDMLFIQEQYKDVKGKITGNYNPKIF
jgi:1-acyl-sn-glycerol-3-phosphate acyltransferase